MMALQTVRSEFNFPFQSDGFTLPKAVICSEGLYSLPDLVSEYPSYAEFIAGAFGPPSQVWSEVSPTYMGNWRKEFAGGRIVLIQSIEDELLSVEQVTGFVKALEGEGGDVGGRVEVNIIGGRHDEVFERDEMVRIVERVVGEARMDMNELSEALNDI